jgi:hypothetical protein
MLQICCELKSGTVGSRLMGVLLVLYPPLKCLLRDI